ncbi:tail fiber assembly protein [Citrobacter amalonaticus]|nr:tail fiber assembly protein [Citrobacter amalonaticus]HCB1891956.1 tail fiber assembly protein [Citrobacter amalonaticus]HCB1914005.1 tail fiber assembly protein [Citrobacter amalonaticus]
MKYFLDNDGNIFAYEDDGSQDYLIDGKTEISKDKAYSLLNPPLSQEEITTENEILKSQLRTVADTEIAWRQDAVDAGIATDEETTALAEWKKYRVLLMRVDSAKPVWPTLPVEQAS